MRKFITILLTFSVCWGAHAITPLEVRNILSRAQMTPGARPAQIASYLCPLLGLDVSSHKDLVVGLWKGFEAGDNIDAGIAQVVRMSTLNPVPVAEPRRPKLPAEPTKPALAPKPSPALTATRPAPIPSATVQLIPVRPLGSSHLKSTVAVSADKANESEDETLLQEKWFDTTFLIGSDRQAVAGFNEISDRLQIFNPLYNQAFPNVPIVHQYDPQTSSAGGFFPLVVKLDPLFIPLLPRNVQAQLHPSSTCELYWVVQDVASVSAIGQETGDTVVFRPHYWAQPGGQNIQFHADVQLLDPQGVYLHLPNTNYSIHPGHGMLIVSPNSPEIPFQDQLKSGSSLSFWSLTTYGHRTALTYHWILGGSDITRLGKIIGKSTTLKELLTKISHRRTRFTKAHIIDEVESIFGQK